MVTLDNFDLMLEFQSYLEEVKDIVELAGSIPLAGTAVSFIDMLLTQLINLYFILLKKEMILLD